MNNVNLVPSKNLDHEQERERNGTGMPQPPAGRRMRSWMRRTGRSGRARKDEGADELAENGRRKEGRAAGYQHSRGVASSDVRHCPIAQIQRIIGNGKQ